MFFFEGHPFVICDTLVVDQVGFVDQVGEVFCWIFFGNVAGIEITYKMW